MLKKLKDEQKIFAASVLGAAALWIIDAVIDAFVFREGTFWVSLLGGTTLHELYFRSIFVSTIILFGFIISRFLKMRRKAEESLREAVAAVEDERIRSESVIAAIADGISIQDREFRVLYQNEMHKRLVGDQLGKFCYEAYAHRDSICPNCPVAETFKDGETHILQKTRTDEHGTHYIEIYASPLKNSKGEIVAGIEAARDITEHKQLEDSLQEQKKFAENVIENSAVATFVLSPEHTVLLWNKACEKLTGVPTSRVINTGNHWKAFYPEKRPTLADILIEKDFEALPKLYKTFARSGLVPEGLQAEGWYPNLNGKDRYIMFDAIPIYSSKGDLAVVIETLQDITGHKRAEESLMLFQEAIEEAMDGVQIVDLGGRIVYSNKAVEEIYGFSADELKGKHVNEMNADPAYAGQAILPALREAGRWNGELAVKHKDGREFPIWLSASTVKNDKGEPIAMVGIIRDITERKQTEYELRAHREHLEELVRARARELLVANERLEQEIAERKRIEEDLIRAQKLESLSLLAGGIAHDFNNLLASVMGNISLTMMDFPHESATYQQLASAERAALRARELTLQLLTFSKGGAPVKTYSSIEQVIRDTADFSLRGSKVRLEFSFPEDLWPVEVDQGQMAQVINNLIINADQAMPEGGAITITGENVVLGPYDVLPLDEGNYVRITVRDRGIGIPREYLTKIFDPYFTTKQKGSGLGLAITYSIIRKHEGYISVESQVGEGTTFRIILPAASERRTTSRHREATLVAGTGRILVMDDETDVRKTTGDILTRLGYTVTFAEEGAQAIDLYRRAMEAGTPFDLTIMDLTVPGGMGGKDAVKKLLEIDPRARVIVSSGYSKDPVMAEYGNYGFRGVVAKPFRVKELSETVHRVMNGHS
jgi:PAS domain S-box-containing protein